MDYESWEEWEFLQPVFQRLQCLRGEIAIRDQGIQQLYQENVFLKIQLEGALQEQEDHIAEALHQARLETECTLHEQQHLHNQELKAAEHRAALAKDEEKWYAQQSKLHHDQAMQAASLVQQLRQQLASLERKQGKPCTSNMPAAQRAEVLVLAGLEQQQAPQCLTSGQQQHQEHAFQICDLKVCNGDMRQQQQQQLGEPQDGDQEVMQRQGLISNFVPETLMAVAWEHDCAMEQHQPNEVPCHGHPLQRSCMHEYKAMEHRGQQHPDIPQDGHARQVCQKQPQPAGVSVTAGRQAAAPQMFQAGQLAVASQSDAHAACMHALQLAQGSSQPGEPRPSLPTSVPRNGTRLQHLPEAECMAIIANEAGKEAPTMPCQSATFHAAPEAVLGPSDCVTLAGVMQHQGQRGGKQTLSEDVTEPSPMPEAVIISGSVPGCPEHRTTEAAPTVCMPAADVTGTAMVALHGHDAAVTAPREAGGNTDTDAGGRQCTPRQATGNMQVWQVLDSPVSEDITQPSPGVHHSLHNMQDGSTFGGAPPTGNHGLISRTLQLDAQPAVFNSGHQQACLGGARAHAAAACNGGTSAADAHACGCPGAATVGMLDVRQLSDTRCHSSDSDVQIVEVAEHVSVVVRNQTSSKQVLQQAGHRAPKDFASNGCLEASVSAVAAAAAAAAAPELHPPRSSAIVSREIADMPTAPSLAAEHVSTAHGQSEAPPAATPMDEEEAGDNFASLQGRIIRGSSRERDADVGKRKKRRKRHPDGLDGALAEQQDADQAGQQQQAPVPQPNGMQQHEQEQLGRLSLKDSGTTQSAQVLVTPHDVARCKVLTAANAVPPAPKMSRGHDNSKPRGISTMTVMAAAGKVLSKARNEESKSRVAAAQAAGLPRTTCKQEDITKCTAVGSAAAAAAGTAVTMTAQPVDSGTARPGPSSGTGAGAKPEQSNKAKARGRAAAHRSSATVNAADDGFADDAEVFAAAAAAWQCPAPPRSTSMPPPVSLPASSMLQQQEPQKAHSSKAAGSLPTGSAMGPPVQSAPTLLLQQAQGGPAFKYKDVVRKKDDREALQGFACKECELFYGAINSWGSGVVQVPSCGHVTAAATAADGQQRQQQQQRKGESGAEPPRPHEDPGHLRQDVSRHRYRYACPSTPPGFWDIGFRDSQDSRCNVPRHPVPAPSGAQALPRGKATNTFLDF